MRISFHSNAASATATWRSCRRFLAFASVVAALAAAGAPARAEFVPKPIRGGGVVTEPGKVGTQVAITWTGSNG
jgi:hypothetical protein